MTLDKAQNIYMVGIKGFGMASLATVLVKMGKSVTGSDVETYFTTDDLLDQLHIKREVGFDPAHVPSDVDVVITTGAHGGLHNPEVDEARRRGVQIYTHAEALGLVMDMFTHRIAICGCHGKTTTSALCSYVMHTMNLPMGYQVGAASFSGLPGGDFTGNEYFVVESDEYVASPGIDMTPRFMYQSPTLALCMNIDLDHVDVYADLDDVKTAFRSFFEKIQAHNGTVVYCHDDENARDVATSIEGLKTRSYGFTEGADVRISTDNTVTFEDSRTVQLTLSIPGKHSILNATGVLIILDELNLSLEEAITHMRSFTGAKSRYEIFLDTPSYAVINDYAHHPTELRATIEASREKYPDRRIIALFQPHTVSRTKRFEKEFIHELSKADEVILLDIFASAREEADTTYTSDKIVTEARNSGIANIRYESFDTLIDSLKVHIQKGDVILWLGAGDKKYLYKELVEFLKTQ